MVTPNVFANALNSVAAKTKMIKPMMPPKVPISTALNPNPPFSTEVAIQIGVSSAPVMVMNAHHTWACVARRTLRSECHGGVGVG